MSTCKNINTISDEICTYICNKYYPNSESSETQEHNTCKTNCDTEIKKELNPFTLKDRLFGYHLDKMGVTETQNSYQEVGDLIATDRDTLDQLIADMTYQESLNDKYCEIQTGIKWKAYNLNDASQKTTLLSDFRKYSSFGLKWEKIESSDIVATNTIFDLTQYSDFKQKFISKIGDIISPEEEITFSLSDLYINDVYEHILPNSYTQYTDADSGAGVTIYYKVKAYDLDIFKEETTKTKFRNVNGAGGSDTVELTNNEIETTEIDDTVIPNFTGFEYSDFILDSSSNIVYIPIIGCSEYSGYSCETIETTLENNCYIEYNSAQHVLREENISNMLNDGNCIDDILKMHNTNNLYTNINQIFNDSTINTSLGNMMGLNKTINNADVTSINSKIDEIIEGMDDDFFSIDDFIRLSTLDLQYWKIESESIATTYYDELTITPTDTELTKLHNALQAKLPAESSIDDLITLEKNQFSDSEWQSLIKNNNQGISNANYIIVDSTYLIPYIPLHDFYYKRGYDVFSKCLKYENVPDEVNTIEIKNYDDAVLGSFKKIGSDVDTYNALIDADDLIEVSQCDLEKTELIDKKTNKYLYNYINEVNNCRVVDSEIAPLDGEKSSYDSYKSKLENYDNGALKNIINSDFSKLNEYSTLEAKFNNGNVNNKFDNYYKHIDDRGGDCKYTDQYYYNDNSCEDESYGSCRYIVDENDANGPLPSDTSNRNSRITLRQMQLTGTEIDKIAVNNTILTNLGSEKLGQLEDNIEEYKKDTYSNKKTTIVNASQWKKYSDLKQAPDFVYSTELLSENIDITDIDDIINDASITNTLSDADYGTLKTELINELKRKLQSAPLDQADSTLINVLSDAPITLQTSNRNVTVNFDYIIQTLFDNNRLDKDVYIKDDTSNYYFLNLNFTQCDVSNVQYSECPSSESCQYVDDYTNSIAKITGGDTEECADYLKYTRDCENYKTAKNIINKRINYDTCIDYFKNGFSLSDGGQIYKISYVDGSPGSISIDPTPSETDTDTADNVIAEFENNVYANCPSVVDNDMDEIKYITYNADDYTCQTAVETPCPENSEVDTSTNRVGIDKCIASIGYYKSAGNYVPCPDGKTTDGIGKTSVDHCDHVKEGYSYSSDTATKCVVGTYRAEKVLADRDITCDECPVGKTTTNAGAHDVSLCDTASEGYYKDGDGYLECPSGKTTSGVGRTSESQCNIVKAGYSYSSGIATKCESGTYRTDDVPANTDITCDECPVGKTTDGDGKTDVSDCNKLVKGYYESAPGTYTECPAGFTTELDSDETDFKRTCSNSNCCDMVAAGYSYDSIKETSTACLVGTYRENDQQKTRENITCTPCSTVGSTTDGDGMTSEDDCNIARKGYYKDGNSYQACPLGSTTYDARMTSDSQCDHVKAGYYIDSDGSYQECAKGTYSLDRRNSDTSANQCSSCPTGTTTESTGADDVSLCNSADIASITNFISSSSDAGGSGGSGGSGGTGGSNSNIIQSTHSDFNRLNTHLEGIQATTYSDGIPDKGIITISSSGVATPDQEYIFIASAGEVIAFIPVTNLQDGYEYDDNPGNSDIIKCSNGYSKDLSNFCTKCDRRDKCINGVKESAQNGDYYCSFNQYFDYTDAVMDCKTDNQACKQKGAITEKYHIQMGKECKLTNLRGDTYNPKCPDGTKLIITGRDKETDKKDVFYGLCQACVEYQRQNENGTACVPCGTHEKYEEKDPQEFDYNGYEIFKCVACEEWEQTASNKSHCMDLPISYKWKYDSNGIRSQPVPLSTNEIKAGHANYGSSDIPTVSYIKGFIITYTSDVTSISPTIDINYTQETTPTELLNKQRQEIFPSYMPKFQNFLDNIDNTNYIFFEPNDGNLKLNNLNYIKYKDDTTIDKIKEIIVVVNKEAYSASTREDESKFMYYLLTNTVNNVIYAQDDTGEYVGHDESNDMLTDRQRYAIHHGTSTKYNYIKTQEGSDIVINLQQTNTDGAVIEIPVNIELNDSDHVDQSPNNPYSVGTPPSSELIYHKDYNKKRYTIYNCEPEKGLYRDLTYTCRYIDDGRFTYGQSITTGGQWLNDPSSAGDPIDYDGDYEREAFTLMNPGSLPKQPSTQQQTDGDFFTIQEHFTGSSDDTIKQCGAVFDLTFPDEEDDNIKKFKPIVNSFTKIGQQYHEEACHYDCNPGMKYVKDNDNKISNNRCEYCPDDKWSDGKADSDDVTCKQHSNLTFTAGAEIPHILWEGDQYQDRQVAYDAQGNYNLLNAQPSEDYLKQKAQQNKIYNYDGAPDNTRPIKCKGGYYNGYYKNSAWNDYTKVTDIYFVKSKIDNSVLNLNPTNPNYIAGLKELTDTSSSLYTRLKTTTGYLPKLHLAIPSLKDVTVVGNTMQLNQDQQDRYITNKDSYTGTSTNTAMKSLYSNSIYYYNNGLDRTWTKVNIDDSTDYTFEIITEGTYDVIKFIDSTTDGATPIDYIITTEPDTLAILDDNFFNITADAITANDLEDLVREIKSEYTSAKQHFYFSGETNDDDTFYMYTPYFNCIECSAGTARSDETDNDHFDSCPKCPNGEYQDRMGQSTCITCDVHRTTTEEGSDKIADCLCDEGYYEDNASSCTMCPIGTYKTEISNDIGDCTDCPVGMGGIQTPSGSSRNVPDSAISGCVNCQNTQITGNSATQSYYERLAAAVGEERVAAPDEGYICNQCPPGSICTAGVISGCEYGYYYDDSTYICQQCDNTEICKGGCANDYTYEQISAPDGLLKYECSASPDTQNNETKSPCDNARCENGKITGCLEGYKYNADTYSCQQCDDNELCIGERSCSSQPCDRTPQSPPPCASPNVCSAGIVTKCEKNSYYDTTYQQCYTCPTNRITGKLAILQSESENGTYNYYISDDDGETWTLKNDTDSDFNIANYSIVEHTDTLNILNGGATELDDDKKDDLKTKLTIDIRDSNADISKCVAEEGYYVTDLNADSTATVCADNKDTMGIGKTNIEDCLAKPGYELDDTADRYRKPAVKCSRDKYKTYLSNSTCSPCPLNTNNQDDFDKTSVDECIADAGYYIVGTGSSRSATICDAGKYISIDQTGNDRDVDSGQCIDNTFTNSDGSTQFNHYSHPGLTLQQYNNQFETIPVTNDPDYANIKSLMVPEPNEVINPEKNTYETCPTNYRNNYGDLTTPASLPAKPANFYGLFDCVPKSGYYFDSTTMSDADTTALADINFARDYNKYRADDFPTALECSGYINNDSLSHHTYKNPTTNYDNIKDVQDQSDCQYPICTLDTTSGSNTYYRNKDNKCIFDAYVENQISASILNDANLPTTLTDFNTANNHNVIDYNIVLFSGSATEDAYIIRNNTRNESLYDYLKLPDDRLYPHDNFKGTRHDDDDSLQLYNDYTSDGSHYAQRDFNNIMFSHEIPTNYSSTSSSDKEKFDIARHNWKAYDSSGSLTFNLKEIYSASPISPDVSNPYKQYIAEDELFVKTHSKENLKYYIEKATNIYFTKERMITDEESGGSVTLNSNTYTTLPYVQLTQQIHPTLYTLLIDDKKYHINTDYSDITNVKTELKTLIDNSTSQSLVLYFGNYKYKFFIDPVKGNFYQYNDSSGASPPSECTEGSYTMKYGATSASDCTWAGPGYYIDSGNTITACSILGLGNAYYRDGYTNTNNQPSDTCTRCPTNKVIDNPQYAGDTVYKHNVEGAQCVPDKGYYGGQGVDASDVYACRVGTYKTHAGGGSSNDVCISCPNNKTTESTGSYLEDHCLPEPGYYGPAGSNSDAIRCSGNTYKDNIEATDISACTSCPRNKVIADNIKNGTVGPVSEHCVPDIGFYGPTGSGSDAVHCPIGKGIKSRVVQYTGADVTDTDSCEDCSSDKISVIGGTGNNYYECVDCPDGGICSGGKYEGGTIAGYYSQYERLLTFKSGDGYGNNDLYLYEYNDITPPGEQVIDLTGTNNNLLDLLKRENGLPPYTKINDYDYDASGSMVNIHQFEGEHNKPYVKFSKTDADGNPTDYYYKWYLSPKECPEGYKCTGDRSAVACPIGTYQDATGGHECTTCNSRNKGKLSSSRRGKSSESDACVDCQNTALNESVVSNNIYVSGIPDGQPNNDYHVRGTYIADTQTEEDMQADCVTCPEHSICTDGKIVGCLEGYKYDNSTDPDRPTCELCDDTEICVGGCIAGYTYGPKLLPDRTEKYGCIANPTDSSNTAIAKSCSSNNAETCNAGKIVTCTTGTIMTDKNSPNNEQDRGYYYDASERTCKVCPTNTYASTATPINVDNKNQDTLYNCIPNSGYYFKVPNSGIYSIDISSIVECPYNKFSKTDTRLSGSPIERCDDPSGNNLCSENEFCQTCPSGTGIKTPPDYPGYDGISNAQATNCRNCIDGTGNTGNLGEYRDSDGTCQTCEAGTKCSGGSSTGCLAGYYIPETRPSGVSNQYNQCYPCIEDHYCTGGDLDANASPCPVGTTSNAGITVTSSDECHLANGYYFTYTAGNPPAYATEQCPGSGPGTPDGEGAFAPSRQTLANFKDFIQGKSGISSYHKTTDCLYNACPDGQHRDFSGSCVQTTTTASPPCTNAQVPISNRYQHGTDISVGPLSWPENTGTGTLYTQPDIQPIYEKYYHQLESANFAPDDTPAIPNDLRLFGNHYECVDANEICTATNTYLDPIS